ncbi:embryo-specific protein ATS3B-like [Mercurialis annua]|uniref:embryo-specific protein ATS3B-like n=1 Tax=Mercurialis annua TaxID=3986 RepID=UPI002160AE9D|nr:embryo-specific protein ATS3B-like [Mercurialis annua]
MINSKTKTAAFLLFLAFLFTLSESRAIILLPQPLESFKINSTQNANTCSYTVKISTSCSSVRYTRDQISLSFGDAYGNQVYAPRIDDPHSSTFESCSTDTFQINGPCTYPICYLYLYRNGYDGWKPKYVSVYGYHIKSVTFNFNTFVPNAVWFGFNYCNGALSST